MHQATRAQAEVDAALARTHAACGQAREAFHRAADARQACSKAAEKAFAKACAMARDCEKTACAVYDKAAEAYDKAYAAYGAAVIKAGRAHNAKE